MTRFSLAITSAVGAALLLGGCTGGVSAGFPASAGATGSAGVAAEGQKIWSRPTEIGYELGDPIQGDAWQVSLLWGAVTVGAESPPALPIIGDVLLVNKVFAGNGLVRSAAADAVLGSKNADGIYLQTEQSMGFSFIGLISFSSTSVAGRALKLKNHGEVAVERADRERYLKALGGNARLSIPEAIAGQLLDVVSPPTGE